jgi:hypothetical protein
MSNRRRRTRAQRAQQNRRQQGNRQSAAQRSAEFWGRSSALPEARLEVTITPDAAAVPRSLGTPPLAGQEAVADYYFAAVYDRAVMLAGALAAAGGLVEPEELER